MHKHRPKERPFAGSLIVSGRNAVLASIEAGNARQLFLSPKRKGDPIIKLAEEHGVDYGYLDEAKLGDLAETGSHQGLVCVVNAIPTYSLEGLFRKIGEKKDPLLFLLDGIEDPVNLGSLLRSADALGIDGFILKERGQSPLTKTVAKVSTGAFNYVPLCLVSNLSMAIKELKKNGYWLVATDGKAKLEYDEIDYSGKMAIVIGSEGFGISRLVKENCDYLVKIPMKGHVNSLNAAVAGALFMAVASLKRKTHRR